jgi:predicted nucleic acid-binding protein
MTDSTVKVLVDTNILVYAHNLDDPDKRVHAHRLLAELGNTGAGVLSAQVLNEFYTASTRSNRPDRLNHDEAAEVIRDLASAWEVCL